MAAESVASTSGLFLPGRGGVGEYPRPRRIHGGGRHSGHPHPACDGLEGPGRGLAPGHGRHHQPGGEMTHQPEELLGLPGLEQFAQEGQDLLRGQFEDALGP